MIKRRRARRDHLARLDEFFSDDAADGRLQVGVGESLLERGDLGGRDGYTSPRRINLLGPRTGAQFGECLFGGPDPALSRDHAIPRQIPSRGRIVSLFL